MINWDNKTVEIRLNDILFNAGVAGLLKILMNTDIEGDDGDSEPLLTHDHLSNNNILILPFSAFDKFEVNYLKLLVSTYGTSTKFYPAVKAWGFIQVNADESNTEQKLAVLSVMKEWSTSNSFLSVFVAMENAPFSITDSDDIEVRRAKAKSVLTELRKDSSKFFGKKQFSGPTLEADVSNVFEKFLPLISKAMDYKQDFQTKAIIYSVVNRFWERKGFLNPKLKDLPVMTSYKMEFSEPLEKALNLSPELANTGRAQKGKCICLSCQSESPDKSVNYNGSRVNFGWIGGLGIDSNKKTSLFWDGVADDDMCPLCALIYSCIPLGFTMDEKNRTAMFINCNNSVRSLVNLNATALAKRESSGDMVNGCYTQYARIIQDYLTQQSNKSREIPHFGGLQFLRQNEDNRLTLNMVTPQQMEVFKVRQKEFDNLVKIKFKNDRGDWVSVYDELTSAFFGGRKQSDFINYVARQYLQNQDIDPRFLWNMVLIDDYMAYVKKGEKQLKEYKVRGLEYWKVCGEEMRRAFDPDHTGDIDNKIRGYAYKLSNSIRMGDVKTTVDAMLMTHLRYGVALPKNSEALWMGEETFTKLSQAYLIGLIGGPNKKLNGGTSKEGSQILGSDPIITQQQ